MTLIKLTDSVFVFKAPTNIGVIKSNTGDAVVIDTGIDDSVAKKLLREVENEGCKIKAIINTHSHADHIGGNPYITAKTGAAVFASTWEAPFIEQPMYEPHMLTGGSFPWKELRNKFLLAKPSLVNERLSPGLINICGLDLEIISLVGHSIDQIGVIYEGVLFAGDSYLGSNIIAKHGIPYNVDINGHLASLQKLENISCKWYVPAHGEPANDISKDIMENKNAVFKLIELIKDYIATPIEAEEIVVSLCSYLGVTVANPGLFFLYRTAVMGFLSYLYEMGYAKTLIADNRLLWQRNL